MSLRRLIALSLLAKGETRRVQLADKKFAFRKTGSQENGVRVQLLDKRFVFMSS